MERQRTECNVENKFNLTSSHYEKYFKDISAKYLIYFSKLCQGNQNCRKGALFSRVNFLSILHTFQIFMPFQKSWQMSFYKLSPPFVPSCSCTFISFLFTGKICEPFHSLARNKMKYDVQINVTTERARTASKPFRLTGEKVWHPVYKIFGPKVFVLIILKTSALNEISSRAKT